MRKVIILLVGWVLLCSMLPFLSFLDKKIQPKVIEVPVLREKEVITKVEYKYIDRIDGLTITKINENDPIYGELQRMQIDPNIMSSCKLVGVVISGAKGVVGYADKNMSRLYFGIYQDGGR